MQQQISHRYSRRLSAVRRLRAKVAGNIVMLALIAAGPAVAQSGSVVGSALDPQSPNESVMPAGGFRLDSPPDAPRDGGYNSLLMPGNASFGLQVYGSYNLEQQRQQPETENESAPVSPQP